MHNVNMKPVFDETIELKDNAMLKAKPDLFDEWDFEKNDKLGLDIYKMTKGNNKKAWWVGECSHSWNSAIVSRVRGHGCPYCASNPKILRGFNDMWTTNPKLASQLLNPEDGYKYTQTSGLKVDWKCIKCQCIVFSKQISYVNNSGLACPRCSDGRSYPEKFMFGILSSLNVEFSYQKVFRWSDNKMYDFYLEIGNKKIIIEVHGIQHYLQTARKGARTLEEEQANDRYKHEMAMNNGIDKYIVIDCRHSEFEWIKNNTINSELSILFDLNIIDWENVNILSNKSLYMEILKLWNDGISFNDIPSLLKCSKSTVNRALKSFKNHEMYKKRIREKDKMVVQLDARGDVIKKWKSAEQVENELGISKSCIIAACKGRTKTSIGYMWRFLLEYEQSK